MKTINIGDHIIDLNSSNIEYKGNEHDITLGLDSAGNRFSLRLSYSDFIFDVEIMSFYIESKHGNQYAHLKHLYVPESLQGFGIGKMSLATFYNLMKLNNISMFSMKFGGGSDSYSYLRHLGFNNKIINKSENMGQQGDSVMVGEYRSLGSRYDEWKLDPISISEFPKSFFNL